MDLSGSHSTVRLLNISKAAILIIRIGINAFQVKLTDQAGVGAMRFCEQGMQGRQGKRKK